MAAPGGAASVARNTLRAAATQAISSEIPTVVTLEADRAEFATGEQVTLTATPNQDIWQESTPYRVIIVDVTTENYLGACYNSGQSGGAAWDTSTKTCSVKTSFTAGDAHTYRAYVAQGTDYASLSDIQATSNGA